MSLEKYFPETIRQLSVGQRAKVETSFFESYSLPLDVRYFPMMLKEMGAADYLVQIADYEYLKRWVQDAEEVATKVTGRYALNPTLQWIAIGSASKALMKEPGVYALWRFEGKINEAKLLEAEAAMISELQDHPELVTADIDDPMVSSLIERGLIFWSNV